MFVNIKYNQDLFTKLCVPIFVRSIDLSCEGKLDGISHHFLGRGRLALVLHLGIWKFVGRVDGEPLLGEKKMKNLSAIFCTFFLGASVLAKSPERDSVFNLTFAFNHGLTLANSTLDQCRGFAGKFNSKSKVCTAKVDDVVSVFVQDSRLHSVQVKAVSGRGDLAEFDGLVIEKSVRSLSNGDAIFFEAEASPTDSDSPADAQKCILSFRILNLANAKSSSPMTIGVEPKNDSCDPSLTILNAKRTR